jgi:hypothetical protein
LEDGARTDHVHGDQHVVQINGDEDHHILMGHTVLQLCECCSYRSTFTFDTDYFLACDVTSRMIASEV